MDRVKIYMSNYYDIEYDTVAEAIKQLTALLSQVPKGHQEAARVAFNDEGELILYYHRALTAKEVTAQKTRNDLTKIYRRDHLLAQLEALDNE